MTLSSASPQDTAALATSLGPQLAAGDTLLLSGPVGAGKTHFARHMIQSVLREPEDVPSPTFTIVQTYDTDACQVWHCDLYRISSTYEIEELGLWDAFEDAICVVEWPDRLGDLAPSNALHIDFSNGSNGDTRKLIAQWTGPHWASRLRVWTQE